MMRAGYYAVLVRTPAIDALQARPGNLVVGPDTDPEQLVGELYGGEADAVVLVGPLDLQLEAHRFTISSDGFVRKLGAQHDRLTALEQLLLRIFYTVVMGWYAEDLDELLRELKQDGDIDDTQAAVLEQLLEEERADRQ